jgi:hypothetical protein
MNRSLSSVTDEYRGKVYGLLGLNLFRLADPAQARYYTELALQHCTRVGDEQGARIYSFNLQVISKA